MYCRNCGSKISNAAIVCPKCGVSIVENARVPNHMVGAILTTIFCCLIGGIVAIIYASQVNTKLALGDVAGAQAASKNASAWIAVNIVAGVVVNVIWLFTLFI